MHSQSAAMRSPLQRPYIRDEQWDNKWRDAWNNAKPSQRKKWLKEAGYEREATNCMYRTWPFITANMRRDVITILKRATPTPAQTPATKSATTQKQFWWLQEKD